jgi:uncharacterized damage-inducible protein DinB
VTDALQSQFLTYSAGKLRELARRIETCLGELTDEQVWTRHSDNENAVGNLVLHLCGNVRQWIIAGVGGQRDVRDRDSEFAARGAVPKADLAERLRGTVEEAAAVIVGVSPERLAEKLLVQKYDVTGLEAIYHVVEHFSHHVGQIIFATKLMRGTDLAFYPHLGRPPYGARTP